MSSPAAADQIAAESDAARALDPALRLPAAVLFDMDGLLIDSEPLWTIAEEQIAAELGGAFTPDDQGLHDRADVCRLAVPLLLDGLDTPAARQADPET